MRKTTTLFQVNGKPFLVPDAPVGISYEDVDSSDAGRDESGYMHRVMVRNKVGVWSFTYHNITEAEKNYMENLFSVASTFQFTRPDRTTAGRMVTNLCYRSKYNLSWYNTKSGLWSNYSFNVIEC